jgi:hypothetical protein
MLVHFQFGKTVVKFALNDQTSSLGKYLREEQLNHAEDVQLTFKKLPSSFPQSLHDLRPHSSAGEPQMSPVLRHTWHGWS